MIFVRPFRCEKCDSRFFRWSINEKPGWAHAECIVANLDTIREWDSKRFLCFESPPTAERLLGRQTYYSIMSICFLSRRSR